MTTLKAPVTQEDHTEGSENALITLVEYGDYECPYCGEAYGVVKQIQEHFKGKLRFVFRNFPLQEVHPHAKVAAEIAEFAGEKGHFWEMHDLIYENQEQLGMPLLIELTHALNLPVKDLEVDLENGTFVPRIQKDFMSGVRSGVNGTPTFFINGERHNGGFEFEDLVAAIEKLEKN